MSRITQVYNTGIDIATVAKLFRVSIHEVVKAVHKDKILKG